MSNVKDEKDKTKWLVDEEAAQVVKHIQAEAGSYLEKLTMTGPQGDETVVLFSNVTVER